MIERMARAAVERLLTRLEAAAETELPEDVHAVREGDAIMLVGPAVRLRALTEARIAGFVASVVRR